MEKIFINDMEVIASDNFKAVSKEAIVICDTLALRDVVTNHYKAVSYQQDQDVLNLSKSQRLDPSALGFKKASLNITGGIYVVESSLGALALLGLIIEKENVKPDLLIIKSTIASTTQDVQLLKRVMNLGIPFLIVKDLKELERINDILTYVTNKDAIDKKIN